MNYVETEEFQKKYPHYVPAPWSSKRPNVRILRVMGRINQQPGDQKMGQAMRRKQEALNVIATQKKAYVKRFHKMLEAKGWIVRGYLDVDGILSGKWKTLLVKPAKGVTERVVKNRLSSAGYFHDHKALNVHRYVLCRPLTPRELDKAIEKYDL